MCILPPICLFCRHYHPDASVEDSDCDAFDEIPQEIFGGDFDHAHPFPGDRGVRFELNEALRGELEDVNGLRSEMGLKPYLI
jgi:hypothetical protein